MIGMALFFQTEVVLRKDQVHRSGATALDESPSIVCAGFALLHERNVIVLANALKDEKRCGVFPTIGDKVRTPRSDRIGIPGAKPHPLLRFAQEQPDLSLDNVERILNRAVAMPRHLLRRRDLKLANAEAWPLCVTSPALYLIEMARILDWFHRFLHLWAW